MGECYNPYPKLPKNIRQIGERDPILKLYVEDYVNTYLKRLYPAGGQDLRVGLLLGESREEDGVPYLFVDGALEMEGASAGGEKVEFSEELWKNAYRDMEQMFPRRKVLGWFLCGAPGAMLSPLNYWKPHGTYFSAKNQLMYVNSGLEGEEAVYTASGDGFYKLRGYSIFYEKNQMMQDYMVSRKDARRVESQTRDGVIRDFRKKMEENQMKAGKRKSLTGTLGTACGILSLVVLAGGVVMVNNYQKMKQMETVIASVMPEKSAEELTRILKGQTSDRQSADSQEKTDENGGTDLGEVEIERVPGEVYPTLAGDLEIQPDQNRQAQQEPSGGDNGASFVQTDVPAGAGVSDSTGTSSEEHTMSESAAQESMERSESTGRSEIMEKTADTADAENTADAEKQNEESGQASQITIPTNASADINLSSNLSSSIPSSASPHIVQTGETLYGICMERYHSLANMETICAWNQLGDGSHLAVGQKIYLP